MQLTIPIAFIAFATRTDVAYVDDSPVTIPCSSANTISKKPTNYLHRDHDVGLEASCCGLGQSIASTCQTSLFGSFPVSVFLASRAFLMHRLLTCRLRSDAPSVVSLYAHVALGQRSAPPILPRFWTELCPQRSAIAACAFCLRCRESAGGGFGPRFRGSAGRSLGCLSVAACRKPSSGFGSRWG